MTTIMKEDILAETHSFAVVNIAHSSGPFLQSLHSSQQAAETAWRKLGKGGRIARRDHAVVALDGPAPTAYQSVYTSMRDYLIDA